MRLELDALVDEDLRLRVATLEDLPAILRICQDPEIQRWTRVPSPYLEQHAHAFISLSIAGAAEGTDAHLLAVDSATDAVLGAVGLSLVPADLAGEVGYWVAPEARGRGVATRGTRLLCRLGFEDLGLGYIGLEAAAANAASNAVAKRLGFTLEGTRRSAMIAGPAGDPAAPRGDSNVWGLRPGELR
jgi:RimJ/RimL family protein N-acetyltransferase